MSGFFVEAEKKKVKSLTLSPRVIREIKDRAIKEERSESAIVNIALKNLFGISE